MKNITIIKIAATTLFLVLAWCMSAQVSKSGSDNLISVEEVQYSDKKITSFSESDNLISRDFGHTDSEGAWASLKLAEEYHISKLTIEADHLHNLYVLFSEDPIDPVTALSNLDNPWINYVFIEEFKGKQELVFENILAKYVHISSAACHGAVQLNNIRLYGTKNSLGDEICFNEIDDDRDGLMDCEDCECGVGKTEVTYNYPSCETCRDGNIYVHTEGGDVVIVNGHQLTGSLDDRNGINIPELNEDFYQIEIINSASGCSKEYAIDLMTTSAMRCPDCDVALGGGGGGGTNVGPPCNNYDFSSGGFANWQASSGNNVNNVIVNVTPGIDPNFHVITDANNVVEPNAPNLNVGVVNGNVLRLGDLRFTTGAGIVEYCFGANELPAAINFIWAWVADNPNHAGPPFFEYQLFDIQGNPLNTAVRINSTDPLLTPGNGTWFYRPMDCTSIDVSQYAGQAVCIKFTSSRCTQRGHDGYAYIKGVCAAEDFVPEMNLQLEPDCGKDVINAQGSGTLYTSYNWEIAVLKPNGDVHLETLPIERRLGGVDPFLEHVTKTFEDLSGLKIDCEEDLMIVRLVGYNDCGGTSVTVATYIPPCPEIIPIVDALTPKYGGCDNEVVQVTGSGQLFETVYFTITQIDDNGNPFGSEVSTENTDIPSYDLTLDDAFQTYTLLSGNSLDCDDELRVTIHLVNECETAEATMSVDVKYPCLTWRAFKPSLFAKNQPPPNNKFRLYFGSPDNDPETEFNCSGINDITGISYYRLSIFDKWGELLYYKEVFDSNGSIDGSELQWNGTFNGSYVPTGVYTYKVEVSTCIPINVLCDNCTVGEYCATGITEQSTAINGTPVEVEVFIDDVQFFN